MLAKRMAVKCRMVTVKRMVCSSEENRVGTTVVFIMRISED